MADIRINQLPVGGGPVATDVLPIDNGTTRKATIQDVVEVGRPTASQAEAEAGTNPTKAMTPLTTKQSIASEVGVSIASAAQGVLADGAAQKAQNLADLTNAETARSNIDVDKAYAATASTINVLEFIPILEWASILNFTSTTDHFTYVQAAYTAAALAAPNGVVVVNWPRGRINLSQAVEYTVPGVGPTDYLLNGIKSVGAGRFATKIFATLGNTEGLIHITTPYAKTNCRFEGMSGISQISTIVNTGQNNGTMFWIKSASSDPLLGYGGLNPDFTAYFKDVTVTGDDFDSGNAVLFYGVWQYGIRIDFQWLPVLEDCLVRTNSDHDAQAFAFADNCKGGIYLNFCYDPQFFRCFVLGFHLSGIFYGKPSTDANFKRSEGGCMIDCEVGNARDGLVIDQACTVELPIQPPNFRVIGCDFNNKRFNISARNWSQLVISATTQIIQLQPYVATARDPGASTNNIAGVRLEDVFDVMIDGIFGGSGNGYFTSVSNAAVGVLCVGRTANVTIKGQMNFNGVGIYADTLVSSNPLIPRRSIVADLEFKGTQQTTPHVIQKLFDPNGVVFLKETEQTTTSDLSRIRSQATSSSFSPILEIDRHRTDFATLAANIPQGALQFRGLDRDGNIKLISEFRSLLVENNLGAEDTGIALYLLVNGSETEFAFFNGNADVIEMRRTTRFGFPIIKPSFSKAALPSASFYGAGAEIFVTDDVGGSIPAFSDGTNWRRVTDRNIIS